MFRVAASWTYCSKASLGYFVFSWWCAYPRNHKILAIRAQVSNVMVFFPLFKIHSKVHSKHITQNTLHIHFHIFIILCTFGENISTKRKKSIRNICIYYKSCKSPTVESLHFKIIPFAYVFLDYSAISEIIRPSCIKFVYLRFNPQARTPFLYQWLISVSFSEYKIER